MSFGFRKSFGSGPFRFTVSKRGISSSFGIRGARITAGPRGTFVTVSSHGIYYRHRIDQPQRPNTDSASPLPPKEEEMHPAFKVPIAELQDSSKDELLQKLTANAKAVNPAPLVFIATVFAFIFLFANSFPVLGVMAGIVGLFLTGWCGKTMKKKHTLPLTYELDEVARSRFDSVHSAVHALSNCRKLWRLDSQEGTSDFKRNAGASTLIKRRSIRAGKIFTRGFTCNLDILGIDCAGTEFYFFPEHVLICSGKSYGAISYQQLNVVVASSRFIENENPPSDSKQVGTTWRFVNKNGGPDRRFNNNHQIPIMQYAEATLTSLSGLQIIIQASNYEQAESFRSQLKLEGGSADSKQESAGPNQRPKQAGACMASDAYKLLGLISPIDAHTAASAYKQQASLYHPDKYAHLAPDIQIIAAAKMRDINAAYELVKQDIASRN